MEVFIIAINYVINNIICFIFIQRTGARKSALFSFFFNLPTIYNSFLLVTIIILLKYAWNICYEKAFIIGKWVRSVCLPPRLQLNWKIILNYSIFRKTIFSFKYFLIETKISLSRAINSTTHTFHSKRVQL